MEIHSKHLVSKDKDGDQLTKEGRMVYYSRLQFLNLVHSAERRRVHRRAAGEVG
jgi:hypothetical protein